jgi:hypothetical protein
MDTEDDIGKLVTSSLLIFICWIYLNNLQALKLTNQYRHSRKLHELVWNQPLAELGT